jgi:hypothetical protein
MTTPENTALLACIRFYFGTITEYEVKDALSAAINWSLLLKAAIDHGVMPLLYYSLKSIEAQVPQSILMNLQVCHRMNGLQNISQTQELLKVLAQLEVAGIDAIAFKGSALAASAYGNIAFRQFNDLDLLVKRQDFWQAKAVLVAAGYQSPVETGELLQFQRYLQISLVNPTPDAILFNQKFQHSLLHSNPERTIDLHWGIPPRRLWTCDRFEYLWTNLDTINLMGQSIQTFSPETALVVQCLNVAKEPWKRSFKQICDVAQIIQAHPDLNWNTVLDLSAELRSQRLFLIGLQVTHKLLYVPLPEFMREKLVGNHSSDERVFESEIAPTSELQTSWWEYTDQLKTLDQARDRIFITGFYLFITLSLILASITSINERDRQFLSLPARLSFLYYVFRPIRLLIQYTFARKPLVVQDKV